MKKVIESEEFVVYDDVFSKVDFEKISLSVQNEDYTIPHINNWLKVWRISDGVAMGSKNYHQKEAPFNNYMDVMNHCFVEFSKAHSNIVGNYNELSFRAYLYGRDTKLNWHNDKGYVAAGIFYTHSYWGSTWGGELMIGRTPTIDGPVPNPCLDHTFEDKFMEYYGHGQYITCKPNRLVLTKGGVWHSINRVDKDAGDHVRSSIVAFFK